jgi:hypothetical protein
MKKYILLSSIFISFLLTGCTLISTEKADLSDAPNGVRIYPPKTYFFVNTEKKQTNIYILPDYANAYDVKPWTIISKQEFNVELSDGMLNKFTANQDTTSFIELFKAAAEAAKSAAAPGAGGLTQNTIEGTFGLDDGIYVLTETGILTKINK